MKHLGAIWICFVAAVAAHAGPTLKEARQEWLQGYYAEAREMYETLAKDAKTRRAATLGLSLALESQGEYDKAEKVIASLLADLPKDADLLARLAELQHTRGRWEEAEKNANAALAADKENFLARWVLGQVYRDRGETDKAIEEFVWFVRQSNKVDISDPDKLRITGLAAVERARYKHIPEDFQTAISDYFNAAVDKEPKLYWLGHFEAGRLFMEKHNKQDAFKRFERALVINDQAVEVIVARGQMSANNLEFKEAESRAERALKINPRYVPALCLIADVHWFSGETPMVLKSIAKAQAVNPRDEAVLARLAACHFAQKKDAEFDAVVKEAQKNNPKCYTFFTDLAGLLEQRKMLVDAEKYYRIAIDLQPKLPEAHTGLGMLHMRMAKEAEAKKTLLAAEAADPFNVRVYNSLKVLKHLDGYETLETEHFILRFEKKNDTVLANFMAIYVENIYKELADQFDYRPKGPFQIQIFNRHEMFSGRIMALPDLHTIGACTGPLVAMVSPRDTQKVIAKPFNWNRVIRHELVHVFNLEQTKGRVPHWFTEGLAVRYEGSTIPPSWHGLLAEKFHAKDLLNLDNILLGFIRPRSPLQWQQAYLQSLLYVEYLTKAHGEKSVGKMLAAFADGLDTDAALEKACNVKKDAFEKGYKEFLGEKVKDIKTPVAKQDKTLKELKALHAKNPDDAVIAVQLAEANYNAGTRKAKLEAKDLVDKLLRKDSKNAGAAYIKSLLLIEEGKTEGAYALLDSVVTDDVKDTKVIKLLARMQYEAKKLPQAARTAERGRKIDPNDTTWVELLGKIYTATKEKEKLLEIADEVVKMDPDAFGPRKMLAQHYRDLGKNEEAERFARKALEVNVWDGECQRILVDALAALNRMEEAERLRRIFGL